MDQQWYFEKIFLYLTPVLFLFNLVHIYCSNKILFNQYFIILFYINYFQVKKIFFLLFAYIYLIYLDDKLMQEIYFSLYLVGILLLQFDQFCNSIIRNYIFYCISKTQTKMLSQKSSQYTIRYEPDPPQEYKIIEIQKRLQDYETVNKTRKGEIKKGIIKTHIFDKDSQDRSNFANILKNVRKYSIVQQFINKLKINNSRGILKLQDQCQYFSIGKTSHQQDFRRKIKEGKAFKFKGYQKLNIITVILKLLIIMSLFFTTTLKLAFDEIPPLNQIANFIILLSYTLLVFEIFLMVQRIQEQKKVQFLSNLYYWIQQQNQIWWISLHTVLFLNVFDLPLVNQILICLLIKNCFIAIQKFKKAQHTFVLQIHIQKYWQLTKIFLLNFFIAHILSICLNLMGSIQVPNQNNWYSQKNIPLDSPWHEKYIWGYYWGTNIMLTVGFGDISASNYIQALILIFIQTFACIILAYNISEVSRILQNITQVQQEKKIKFKIFNQLGQKYNFEDNFKKNVVNHIQRSIQQKHELNYIEERIVDELPEKIKLQVKRQINKNVFQQAYFFKNLTKKTQNLLAQKVQKLFAHPQQIILKNKQNWKIYILRQGKIALTFKKGSSINNGTVIQKYEVSEINKPLLLSLKFIRKNQIVGDLKSMDFSILNTLQVDKFQQILKQYDIPMFQFYCSERDKTQYHFFDLQIFDCPICQNLRHQKTHCPKMHYIPLKEKIIFQKWIGDHGHKQHRNGFQYERKFHKKAPTLKIYKQNAKYQIFYKQRSLKQVFQIFPSLQFINANENIELSKKIEKCLSGIDTTIKLLKGQQPGEQLVVDLAQNYKRYFSKYNPDNLGIRSSINYSSRMNISERLRSYKNIANIL